MQNQTTITQIGLFVLLVLCAACSQDIAGDHSNLPEGQRVVEVRLQRAANSLVQPHTRGEEPGDTSLGENSIQHLTAFLFDQQGNLKLRFESGANLVLDSSRLRLYLSDDEATRLEGEYAKLVVVANHKRQPLDPISTYPDLQALTQQDEWTPSSLPAAFLMDGTLEIPSVSWTPDNSLLTLPQPLELARALAKVRLTSLTIDVKDQDNQAEVVGTPRYQWVNSVQTTTLLPGSKTQTDSFERNTSSEWVAFERQDIGGATHYILPRPLYSYASDWSTSGKEPYDPEREAYIRVEVKLQFGEAQAQPYYYRIPINYTAPQLGMSESELAGLYQLQRNHSYLVSSTIHILGSEKPEIPLEVKSKVSIEPWLSEDIDGSISKLSYLIVNEKKVVMPNTTQRDIRYLSSAPEVEVTIDQVSYTKYNEAGEATRVEMRDWEIKALGIEATLEEIDGFTVIRVATREVPNNFVPRHLSLTLKQTTGDQLSEQIAVIQYPPKYITAEKSQGFTNAADKATGPDFRFHDILGSGSQVNEVLFKVTTLVNAGNEKIGDPTETRSGVRSTKKDSQAAELISPEFIIASQHGMTLNTTPQYEATSNSKEGWYFDDFPRKGPYRAPYTDREPYDWKPKGKSAYYYKAYSTAEERCANYFEDEYGRDGTYTEHYINRFGKQQSRQVNKTFKYQGSWRIPTTAELKYINQLQKEPTSAVKSLLKGDSYWAAETGKTYSFKENNKLEEKRAPVRCIFDTWNLPNRE